MSVEIRKPATDPQELAQFLVARANTGDVEGMVELYEPEAVLAIGGGNVAMGSDQIRAFYTSFLATGVRFSVGEQRPAMHSGDIALTSTRLPNGVITAEVARRQPDGSGRWVIDQPAVAQ
jgi:SnoaL-like domain